MPLALLLVGLAAAPQVPVDAPPLALEPFEADGVTSYRGTFRVPEDRRRHGGRQLHLDVVVLSATGPDPAPDPVVVLAGGPGMAATDLVGGWRGSPLRGRRDLVFLDQRGTGGDHRLDCPPGAGARSGDLTGPTMDPVAFRECRRALAGRADLRLYSSEHAADDLEALREACGYERLDLVGGSYGTRAALVFLRRHPTSVRTVTLRGVAPLAFRNPLAHARSAQHALERVAERCALDPGCSEAFPDFLAELEGLLERARRRPVVVRGFRDARTGEPASVRLGEAWLADGVRLMLYQTSGQAALPRAVHRATEGDWSELAAAAVRARDLRRRLAMGMLLCVTCAEDVDRIPPGAVAAWTDGTFLGDRRVREQRAACEGWPRSELSDGFGDPVRVDVPALIVSGESDGVTPPRWGDEVARNLPRSLHLVVRRAHDLAHPGIDAVVARFVEAGTVDGLDTSEARAVDYPPFELGR